MRDLIELRPVECNGTKGAMTSVHFRGPDQNLLEVSRFASD
jgi:hypothetical protein